uniref:Phenoloxidase 2 n=1 Tax=Cacopsylla melanoneura TaxID=428564 RepID=A0A8D8QNQ3_9HEMI
MNLQVCVLALLFQMGTSWLPPSATGNLWLRSPFMLPPQIIENEMFLANPPPAFIPLDNRIDVPSPTSPVPPVNAAKMSDHMFKLYFDDKNDPSLKEPEDFLEYFRHDLGVNLFHYHWHSANPFNGPLVGNHRRGESFYYMHQQLLARYNTERLGNGEAPIPSAHDIKELETQIVNKYQLPHYDQVLDGGCESSYVQMQNWTNNIIEAINQGYAISMTNDSVPVSVDLLGNMIQPSSSTPNGELYGNAHNMGHNNIAYCHYKGKQKMNIQLLADLGDTRTAPRCPVFYRFHTYIDDLFKIYLKKLPEYTRDGLDYPGIELKGVKLITDKGPTTEINTYWQEILMDNLYSRDKLTVEYDTPYHLQHEDFKYEFTIENHSDENKSGTMRIFLVAKNDVKGKEIPLSAQRSLFIELDKFRIHFPAGKSNLVRSVNESVVSVKLDEVFRSIAKGKFRMLDPEEGDFCACGWPDYFLLPRGNEEGMKFYLYAMISSEPEKLSLSYDPNYTPPNPRAIKRTACKEAYSYCGQMESEYPDPRPMGYPWDRPAPKWASTLADFLTPNMLMQEITIKYTNKTVPAEPDLSDNPTVLY